VAVKDEHDLSDSTNVGDWTQIVQVSAGEQHTVGLKSDGTVMAVGFNWAGQLNVDTWTDIVQVSAGGAHTVGLKSNGTVVAVGDNQLGQLEVGSWTDIVQVSAGYLHTVGLKSNGTVAVVGNDWGGQINAVGTWTNIVQVAGGDCHTVGLKSNGTVVAVGENYWGQLDISDWNLLVSRLVTIDIKPGSLPNSINLKSKGKVPVAILSTDDFDAYDVDPDTCIFANANPVHWKMVDVNKDGDRDMLLQFMTQELELIKSSTEATLECATYDGILTVGTDSVNILPKGKAHGKEIKKGR